MCHKSVKVGSKIVLTNGLQYEAFCSKTVYFVSFLSAMQMNEMEYLQRGDFNFVGTVPVSVKWHVHYVEAKKERIRLFDQKMCGTVCLVEEK